MFLITMGQTSLNKATLSLRSIIPLSSKKAYIGKRTENTENIQNGSLIAASFGGRADGSNLPCSTESCK